MSEEGSERPTRGVGWLLAHPGWAGIGGLIAIAGLVVSLWPQSSGPADALSPPNSMASSTTAQSPAPTATVGSATTTMPAPTTTTMAGILSVLDVGVRPSVFDDRLGQPTRVAPTPGSTGESGGFDLFTWRLDDVVVEAVVDTNEDVVRGYTVTILSRSLAPSVPHLPDNSPVVVGESSYADVTVPPTGRQGVNPPNGRFHYAEAFYAGASTGYRSVVLITSHAAPVELVNRSTTEAFEGFRSINDCLGFGLTELPCEGRPELEAVRGGMVITGYAVADPRFENWLPLSPEDL